MRVLGVHQIPDEEPWNPAPGVWMIRGMANTGMIETDDGLILMDMPVPLNIKKTMQRIRQISNAPVYAIFLSHGHFDHSFHLNHLFEEAEGEGFPPPQVIAHRNILERFKKYRLLAEFHERINRVQYDVPEGEVAFPGPERNPDVIFDQSFSICKGGLDFHAYHGLGETDDAIWVWIPEKKTILAGDFVMPTFPNVGNPFKVQRYALQWAETLEAMLAKDPEIIIPGHGPVLQGRDNIRECFLKTSKALRYLHDEVVKRLNRGMLYEDIIHDVHLPEEMIASEWLKPWYGCPEFTVHGILRQYTGWWDGNPTNLFPPKKNEVAAEVVSLVGIEGVIAHAHKLKNNGKESMALQFVDMALSCHQEDEKDNEAKSLKLELLKALAEKEPKFMARNIYNKAVEQGMKFTVGK